MTLIMFLSSISALDHREWQVPVRDA